MATIQYNPTKKLFLIKVRWLTAWRSLQWLMTYADKNYQHDWQVVINNPQQKFIF